MSTATKYDAEQIARELTDTAEGRAYYGNALYVAQDMPEIVSSLEHRAAIKRYLEGKTIATDHARLHEAAAMIRGTWKPEPQYPEHEKLKAVREVSQRNGEFLEWLQGKFVFAEYHGERLFQASVSIPALLAEFHGIDQEKLEEEKEAMLTELRFVKAK